MSEDAVFFRQAAEAIVAISLNAANVDPTIRELLSRIKYVNPGTDTKENKLPNESKTLLNLISENKPEVKASKERKEIDYHSEDTQDPKSVQDRQFPCAKCKLVFRRSSDLRRHERTHLPVLPNICSQCGKGFARKDALKRHFDTLTCRRNRSKLLSIGGDINEILERAQQTGTGL
ncbi:related to Transcriptional regulator MET32 [Zygosaccharomyces bailii]|nr:related to Transcriptional regulator MET32 [Zygosaccharomyces bailii]